jgi:membrane-bound lytic murein transglycosylase D
MMKKILSVLFFVVFAKISLQAWGANNPSLESRVRGNMEALSANPFLKSREVSRNGEHALSWFSTLKKEEIEKRISGISRQLPFVYSNNVDYFIRLFCESYYFEFDRLMAINQVFNAEIEGILVENGLPKELKYLPILLSGFNPHFTSESGQRGFWQLQYPVALRYKLEIDETVDERCDLRKSTSAACKYLHSLYAFYGDWPLAVAAFSTSPSVVNQSIKRYENNIGFSSKDCVLENGLGDYWDALTALNFLGKFAKFNNYTFSTAIDSKSDKVIVSSDMNLLQPAEVLHIPIERMRELNFALKGDYVKSGREIFLPVGYASVFYSKSEEIYNHRRHELVEPADAKTLNSEAVKSNSESVVLIKKYHKIRSGETLGRVASNYGVTKADLREWNNLATDKLKSGQRIIVKVIAKEVNPNQQSKETKSVELPKPQNEWIWHVVKRGETLSAIGSKYGVSYLKIKEWNGLRSDNIAEGQKLKIIKR